MRLRAVEKRLILQRLAEYEGPSTITEAVKKLTGREIDPSLVSYYSQSKKWGGEILRIRRELEADLADVPISSKRWRLRRRQELYGKATKDGPGTDLKTARSVLTDAANELGELRPREPAAGTNVQVNVAIMGEVFQMGRAELERYAAGDGLDPGSFLADVRASRSRVAEAEADATRPKVTEVTLSDAIGPSGGEEERPADDQADAEEAGGGDPRAGPADSN